MTRIGFHHFVVLAEAMVNDDLVATGAACAAATGSEAYRLVVFHFGLDRFAINLSKAGNNLHIPLERPV